MTEVIQEMIQDSVLTGDRIASKANDIMPLPTLPSLSLEDWEKIGTIAAGAVAVVGLIGGAGVAIVKHFRTLPYALRLAPSVSGRATLRGEESHLIIKTTLENKGVSTANITQEKTAIRVFVPRSSTTIQQEDSSEWVRLITRRVLSGHTTVQGGETVTDTQVIVVPKGIYPYFKVELIVCAGGQVFLANEIVSYTTE